MRKRSRSGSANPVKLLPRFLAPALWLLNQSTRLLLKLVGIEYSAKFWYSAVSAEELQVIITSNESSGLEDEERELLKNVFEFGEATAGEIMVPRTSIECINYDDTVRDLLNAVNHSNHSAYPVAGESLDDIRGVVQLKEVVGKLGNDSLQLDQSIQPFIRPVRFVSEDTYLDELLPQFQRSHKSMVMVVDEFGGTAGLVTLEDILEEIAGDAGETTDNAMPGIRAIDDQTF
jgi:CBS domain containing-hemolysin-like protein